jgi:hypothetical protein
MLAADVAAVSDGSLALDGEADARVGGALGGEWERSLCRNCLTPCILVAFVLQQPGKKKIRKTREKNPKPGYQLPSILNT